MVCFILLVSKRNESYTLFAKIGKDEDGVYVTAEKKPTPRGGAKYGLGSDYSRIKQRRAISQIRTDGKDS